MLYTERPKDFSLDALRICMCIVYHVGWPREILNLLRAPTLAFYPDLWGLPGGTIESGESEREAILRELEEETGIVVHFSYFALLWAGRVFVRFPDGNEFDVTLFTLRVWDKPRIILNPDEHTDYAWLTRSQMLKRACVPTNDLCLEYCGHPEFLAGTKRPSAKPHLVQLTTTVT
ncbi:MAG: NUDIX hydrolase [Candidatus Andersenbacteria bacterium]